MYLSTLTRTSSIIPLGCRIEWSAYCNVILVVISVYINHFNNIDGSPASAWDPQVIILCVIQGRIPWGQGAIIT